MPRNAARRPRRRHRTGGKGARKTVRKAVRRELMRAVETKEKDLTYSTLGLNSVSYGASSIIYGLVNTISQGTNDGERVGNELYIRGIRFNFAMQNGDNTNMLRLIFLTPKGNIGSPTVAQWAQEIFSNTASGGTQWCAPVDTDRYNVYYDRVVRLVSTPADGSTSTQILSTRIMKGFIRVNKRFKYSYQGASGTILPNKEIYVVAISDSAVVTHPGAVAGFLRIYYKDA